MSKKNNILTILQLRVLAISQSLINVHITLVGRTGLMVRASESDRETRVRSSAGSVCLFP